MRVSQIMGSRHVTAPVRRVGVQYSADENHRVMAAAVDLYRHLGVDVEVHGGQISVECGEALSTLMMQLIERRTGHMGFNEWWAPAPSEYITIVG